MSTLLSKESSPITSIITLAPRFMATLTLLITTFHRAATCRTAPA